MSAGLPSVFWHLANVGADRQPCVRTCIAGASPADEAKQLGFINEIVEQARVLDAALDAARRPAKQPPPAHKLSKVADPFDAGASQPKIGQLFERRTSPKRKMKVAK